MSVLRRQTLISIDNIFTQSTLDWHQDTEKSGLDWYVTKYGVFHLLGQNRIESAEQRMLDPNFMASYIKVWSTFVEPWKSWRVIGIEKARSGFMELATSLKNKPIETDVVSTISAFLGDVGLYQSGTVFAEWLLERRESDLGVEHPDTLIALGNLAILYESQGRYSEAEPLYLRDLEASERTLGVEHPYTLSSLHNLAGLYESQGRYSEAEPLYLRDLEASERTLGMEHPDTLTCVSNLALLYDVQGRYSEAEPLYLRALEASERTLGMEHPDTLLIVGNLAGLFSSQSRYSEAEPLCLRILEAGERILGMEHPDTLTSVNNLALLYKSQSRYSEAEPLYLRALEASERTLGMEHPDTLIALGNLGGFFMAQTCYSEAEPLYLRALEAGERILGMEHPDTLTSVNNLALLYDVQGRYSEAEPLYLRVLEASERTLGLEHAKTLGLRYSLGMVYLKLQRITLALMHLQKTLDGEIALFGHDARELAMTYWNLARAYRLHDDPKNASMSRLRCWEIEVQHNERLDADVLYTVFAYLNDLIASNQHSVAQEFRAMIYKEFEILGNPSEEQIAQFEQIQSLEI